MYPSHVSIMGSHLYVSKKIRHFASRRPKSEYDCIYRVSPRRGWAFRPFGNGIWTTKSWIITKGAFWTIKLRRPVDIYVKVFRPFTINLPWFPHWLMVQKRPSPSVRCLLFHNRRGTYNELHLCKPGICLGLGAVIPAPPEPWVV